MVTWNQEQQLDSMVNDSERGLISSLDAQATAKCPHLSQAGLYFFYCGKDVDPDDLDRIRTLKRETCELLQYCMSQYSNCCHYRND